jgi:DNA-binding NarL/FixJ family response regulator
MDQKTRILVIDDENLSRLGLCSIINQQPDFEVVDQIGCVLNELALIKNIEFDVAIMYLKHPVKQHLYLIPACLENMKRNMHASLLVLTESVDEADIIQIIQSGASGFLPIDSLPEEFYIAIRCLYRGQFYISPDLAFNIVINMGKYSDYNGHILLTPQQSKVLRSMVSGRTNREIAHDLGISERTVEAHARQIYKKLRVTNRTQAFISALHLGLVDSK